MAGVLPVYMNVVNVDDLCVAEEELEVEPEPTFDYLAFEGGPNLDSDNQEYDPNLALLEQEQDYFSTHGTVAGEDTLLGVCTDISDGSPLECSGLSPLKKDEPGRRISVESSEAVNSKYAKPRPALR